MARYIRLILCKLNFLYPQLLGFAYLSYRKNRIQKHRSQFDSSSELIDFVTNAIEHIPYYQANYNKKISAISEFEQHIKPIDKDVVMANFDSFHPAQLNERKVVRGTTGGTSGKPLQLIIPKNRYVFELATLYSMWNNVGWKGQIRGVMRNHHLKPNEVFRIDPIKREFIFDGFKTDEDYFMQVYNVLKKYRIRYLHSYPSSAYQFALFLKKKGLDCSIFTAFLCGSEGFTQEQRQLIVKQLGIKVYNWYGHSEKLVLGGYCPGSDLIHIEPTYGYVELLDEDGSTIRQEGVFGEITGTSLHNPYMPLIRYRTGDYAEYAGNYCPHCKRHLMLVKNIQGRRDITRIYFKDKSFTSITALNLHSDLYEYIEGMQYIQKEVGKLNILLIKGVSYSPNIERRFHEHFERALGEKCDFIFSYVSKIEKEANGKFLPLKQLVKK